MRLLALWFVIRFVTDACILYDTYQTPQFSIPKAGIWLLLLPLAWVLVRQKVWGVCLAGVVCLFWLAFAVARAIGYLMPGAAPDSPYPWANWVALPAALYLLHYAQRFSVASPSQPRGG